MGSSEEDIDNIEQIMRRIEAEEESAIVSDDEYDVVEELSPPSKPAAKKRGSKSESSPDIRQLMEAANKQREKKMEYREKMLEWRMEKEQSKLAMEKHKVLVETSTMLLAGGHITSEQFAESVKESLNQMITK